MKNNILKIILSIFLFILVIDNNNVVHATEQYYDSNKQSVVQVVMYYTSEDGKRSILQSGSGIVINSNTVLTNRHVVHINNANMKKAKKRTKKKDLSRDSILIAIVKQDDVLINASIAQESQEKDFALLTLEELTDRTPAVLGSSSTLVAADRVTAIGCPTTDPFSEEGAQLFDSSAAYIVPGIVAEIGENITVNGTISSGNSGGALVSDTTGQVVGLLVYQKEDVNSGKFSVMPIDQIKDPYLAGTSYTDGSVVPSTEAVSSEESSEEQPTDGTEETPIVDKSILQSAVASALTLNSEDYTEVSYLYLYDAIKDAQYVLNNENVTQEEVDRSVTLIQDAKQALVMQKGISGILIFCIVLAVIVVIAIVVVVIMLINLNKKKKEQSQFRVIPQNEFGVIQEQSHHNVAGEVAAASEQVEQMSYSNCDTVPLNRVNANSNIAGTTVLTQSPSLHACLIRTKTGERKDIDAKEFIIGLDPSRVNYCITDNATISRCHMKIITEGIRYYAMDLGSTNRTYVNGAVIPPNQKIEIKSGDCISVSDEEFTFEVK